MEHYYKIGDLVRAERKSSGVNALLFCSFGSKPLIKIMFSYTRLCERKSTVA